MRKFLLYISQEEEEEDNNNITRALTSGGSSKRTSLVNVLNRLSVDEALCVLGFVPIADVTFLYQVYTRKVNTDEESILVLDVIPLMIKHAFIEVYSFLQKYGKHEWNYLTKEFLFGACEGMESMYFEFTDNKSVDLPNFKSTVIRTFDFFQNQMRDHREGSKKFLRVKSIGIEGNLLQREIVSSVNKWILQLPDLEELIFQYLPAYCMHSLPKNISFKQMNIKSLQFREMLVSDALLSKILGLPEIQQSLRSLILVNVTSENVRLRFMFELQKCINLETLVMMEGERQGNPARIRTSEYAEALHALVNLRELRLGGMFNLLSLCVPDELESVFQGKKSLVHLELQTPAIESFSKIKPSKDNTKPSFISVLSNATSSVTSLKLSDWFINNARPGDLHQIRQLTRLDLSGCSIYDALLSKEIISHLHNLVFLSLERCTNLTDRGVRQLSKLPKLRHLILSYNYKNIGEDSIYSLLVACDALAILEIVMCLNLSVSVINHWVGQFKRVKIIHKETGGERKHKVNKPQTVYFD